MLQLIYQLSELNSEFNKQKEHYSVAPPGYKPPLQNNNLFTEFLRFIIMAIVNSILILIIAVKISRCHYKDSTLNLLAAILLSPLYIIVMLFKGKFCISK
jgi:hypothetical protein